VGPDEDALTLGVAAARAALTAAGLVSPAGSTGAEAAEAAGARRVVFVTRELPLLVGGNAAALLAGIGLAADVAVVDAGWRCAGGPTRAKTTAVVISYSCFVDSTRDSRSRARHVESQGN